MRAESDDHLGVNNNEYERHHTSMHPAITDRTVDKPFLLRLVGKAFPAKSAETSLFPQPVQDAPF